MSCAFVQRVLLWPDMHFLSPAAGVQGIMNAFLRTGPQMLSPEPAATGAPGAIIPAPGAAAVPAQGLMAVAGRGGTGVYGMMHAYLRTGPDMLSPEPGAEEWVGIPAPGAQAVRGAAGRPSGQQQPVLTVQAAQHGGLAQLYSPIASPLADTPARVPDISGQPVMPSSICSNAESSSSAGAPAASISLGRPPVPRLPLERLCSVDNGEAGVEAGAEQLPEPTLALSVGADSEAGEELPTARLLPAWGQAAQCAAPAAAPRLPSPISFVLPGDSPAVPSPVAAPAADADRGMLADWRGCPTSVLRTLGPSITRPHPLVATHPADSPSFSFGLGATAAPLSGAPDAEQEAQQQSEAAQADVPGEGALAGEGNGPISAGFPLQRIRSGETVQGPNPFQAMLRHLNHSGPGAYASPAPAPTAPRCDSPQSPLHLTPLHLISAGTSDASPPLPLAPSATPELGVGSLTAWAQRRGMAGTLGSRAMADLRTLWGAVTAHRAAETEADAAREEAAVLAAEVEVLRGQLADLGVEHEAALAAANAGALCAKSEVARAQEAARQMMALAEQIQATFAACEEEKAALLAELQAAQEHLAASEASAASAEVSEARAAELAAQLEAARTAVSAAEAAAADAQARAEGASAELDAVRAQLEEAAAEAENARQAEQQQAQDQAAEEPSPAPAPAPPLLDSLRSQLGAVASTLRAMLAKQAGWQGQDGSPAVQSLLSRSRRQLELVEALVLGGTGSSEPGPLAANTALRAQVAAMRSVLAAHGSPAAATSAGSILLPAAAGPAAALFGSPVPFSLAAEGSGERGTPGTVSDAFSSPYLPSRTTITVDFRDFSQSLVRGGGALVRVRARAPGHASCCCCRLARLPPRLLTLPRLLPPGRPTPEPPHPPHPGPAPRPARVPMQAERARTPVHPAPWWPAGGAWSSPTSQPRRSTGSRAWWPTGRGCRDWPWPLATPMLPQYRR